MRIAALPWRTDPQFDHEVVLGDDGRMVADCSPRTAELNRAHARLTAAAPDLLAVAYVVREYGLTFLSAVEFQMLEAAIAKAEAPHQ